MAAGGGGGEQLETPVHRQQDLHARLGCPET
jgi:hypothetical protein